MHNYLTMSRRKKENLIDAEFAIRFKEVCGTDKPTEIKKNFGFSYQAAKNYLNGNYPETSVLLKIASKTSYSIHWLLTGKGEKKISDEPRIYVSSVENKIEIESLIRKIFLQEVGKFLVSKNDNTEETEDLELTTFLLEKKQIKTQKTVLPNEKKSQKKD